MEKQIQTYAAQACNRVQCTQNLKLLKQTLYKSCFLKIFLFGIVILTTNSSIAQYTLSGNETWTSATDLATKSGFEDGIIVGANTLTINGNPFLNGQPPSYRLTLNATKEIFIDIYGKLILNGTTILMNDDCKIKINVAGQMYCSNGTLIKHKNGNGNLWLGIELLHNVTGPDQFTTYQTADGNGDCTSAEWDGVLHPNITLFKAESTTIENAKIGVNSVGNPVHLTTGGGVVRVRNSFFNNCEIGIQIINGSSFAKPNMTASYIMHTDFKWTDITAMDNSRLTHIDVYLTNGLNIGGCNFYNYDGSKNCHLYRGIGIKAGRSSISIKSDGDKCCKDENNCPDNCYAAAGNKRRNTFEFLGKGISFLGETRYNSNKLGCKFSDFKNCALGIEVFNSTEVAIGNCNFTTDATTYNGKFDVSGCPNYAEMVGIRCQETSGTNIYKNNFLTDLDNFHFVHFAMPIIDYRSSIKNNKFESTYVFQSCGENIDAVFLSGNNNNLDIICNEFINIGFDIFIETDGFIDDIPNREAHELSTTSAYLNAKNTYSTVPLTCYYNINNIGPYVTTVGINANNNPRVTTYVNKHTNALTTITEPSNNNPLNANSVNCNFTCTNLERKPSSINQYGINKFKIFPNPTINSTFTLEILDFDDNYTVKIFDINGRLLFEKSITEFISTIDLNLPNGIYAVQVSNITTTSTKLLVLQ